jgi:putative transposase
VRLFEEANDYAAFEKVLEQAHEQVAMRTVAYCLMPNHWHFVLWPRADRDLPEFMHWLTMTHAKRWRGFHQTVGHGHVYQWRYRAFPVQSDAHFLTLCRYVERNALRAGLVARAEDWRWCSLYRKLRGDAGERALLSDGPLPLPDNWVEEVNAALTEDEAAALRDCSSRGRPYGANEWALTIAERLGLLKTLRPRGRPPKS